jgi:xanthine/uracil/vitamin C permease (AzgA family)
MIPRLRLASAVGMTCCGLIARYSVHAAPVIAFFALCEVTMYTEYCIDKAAAK